MYNKQKEKLVLYVKTVNFSRKNRVYIWRQSANSMAVLFDIFGGGIGPSRKKMINMLSLYNMYSVINILSMYFNNSLIRAALLPPPDTDN